QSGTPVGTKAQRALSLQREQSRQARKTRSRALREEERALRFEQRQEKRRQKHNGH
ncbi:MAG: DUF2992 family protein, partial [Oscillospiraceae bacterium]|nr:DUF2992 family protein [Oscillospiraceae bacterium]